RSLRRKEGNADAAGRGVEAVRERVDRVHGRGARGDGSGNAPPVAGDGGLLAVARAGRRPGASRSGGVAPGADRVARGRRFGAGTGRRGVLPGGPGMRRRSFVSEMYRAARVANDVSVLASGNPSRIARRAKNKI